MMSSHRAQTDAGGHFATCLGCGCACDDIAIRANGGRIAPLDLGCDLGQRWFRMMQNPPDRLPTIDGEEVSQTAATVPGVTFAETTAT